METYVFKTTDFGKTWKNIKTAEIDGFAHVIKEDPKHQGHLYVGTEYGLFFSFNDGKSWIKLKGDFPTVSVMDLAIQNTERDLVVATHGRGLYILDDINPLGEMSDTVLNKDFHLFSTNPAHQFIRSWAPALISPSDADFLGKNESYGARINYFIKELKKPEKGKKTAKNAIEILDGKGQVIRRLKPQFKKGFNRIHWDLRQKAFSSPGSSSNNSKYDRAGMFVLPGVYQIKITYNGQEFREDIEVRSDPRLGIRMETLTANRKIAEETGLWMENMNKMLKSMSEVKKGIDLLSKVLDDADYRKKVKAVYDKMEKLKYRIIPKRSSVQGIYRGSRTLAGEIGMVNRSLSVFPVTHNQRVMYEKSGEKYKKLLDDYNQMVRKDLKELIQTGKSLFKAKADEKDVVIKDKDLSKMEIL